VDCNGLVIGVKPVSSEGRTGFFKDIQRFPSSFDFLITFPIDSELAFLSLNLIFKNLFNFSFFLSLGIEGDWLCGAGFREVWESFEVWSEVDSKVAVMNPRVDGLHDRRAVEFVVIVSIRSFADCQGS